MLICKDAGAEIDFCVEVFGAEELSRRSAADGSVIHATLKVHESLLMVHDESPHLASRAPGLDGNSSVVNYLYGDEVDPIMERAVAAGGRVVLPPEDQSWGDRVGRIIDPAGHVWNIASRKDEK